LDISWRVDGRVGALELRHLAAQGIEVNFRPVEFPLGTRYAHPG
jgi:hypothetical protein